MFDQAGCTLISEKYNGAHSKLNYKCICGTISKTTFTAFLSGTRCMECKKTRLRELKQLSLQQIRKEIEKTGIELLEKTYINNKTPLTLRCHCGNTFKRNLDSFRASSKNCLECSKLIGEKSPNWRSDLSDEERVLNRDYHEYNVWRKGVFERDKYSCQKCRKVGGSLVAHHIKSYARYKEHRVDTSNGVTLCELCHDEFHLKYSYKNFTEDDYYEWLSKEAAC